MTTLMETKSETLVRPLPVLVPLIKEQLNLARIAEEEAGLPYYYQAGKLLNEAREQLNYGEWGPWLKRNFALSETTARRYMKVADKSDQEANPPLAADFAGQTLSGIVEPNRHPSHRPAWHHQVLRAVEHVDIGRLTQERMRKEKELRLVRDLARQIIDIGFKVLATKLHPDKTGGSREAMQRLNQAKDLLKQAVL